MECITSPSFSLGINGETYGYFRGGNGLRQGNPISTLIFVLAMDCFSRLMNKMCKKEQISFHYQCKQLRLTHLIFVDDLRL